MEETTGSYNSASLYKDEALAVLILFKTGERLMNEASGDDGQRWFLRSRVIRETFRELQKTRKKTKKYVKRVLRSRKQQRIAPGPFCLPEGNWLFRPIYSPCSAMKNI